MIWPKGSSVLRLIRRRPASCSRASSRRAAASLGGRPRRQHDEFLAAVARDMAMVVRDMRQRIGDQLDDAVARLRDRGCRPTSLRIVDVAKGNAQRLAARAGFFAWALEQHLEGAAVRQAGQIVDLGVFALGAGGGYGAAISLHPAAAHFFFGMARAVGHGPWRDRRRWVTSSPVTCTC